MKSLIRTFLCLLTFAPFLAQAQAPKNEEIQVFPSVLKTAEWANFKYMDVLNKAKSGDKKSILDFLEFSSIVDGTEALQHATTCIEIIPFVPDDAYGAVISTLKPKLKTLLLERFTLAQGRTKKEALQKPLMEWAPLTWKALNGELVRCSSCMQEGGLSTSKPGQAKKPNSAESAPAASGTDTGKQ
ncbi:MAG: hypothetical protein IT261_08790 [Saprospiraceae bacterium]|nr:hypothetical protein [Saprospiraceae bacterium]